MSAPVCQLVTVARPTFTSGAVVPWSFVGLNKAGVRGDGIVEQAGTDSLNLPGPLLLGVNASAGILEPVPDACPSLAP